MVEDDSRFKPFEVKTGMSVAPPVRKQLAPDMKIALDEGLQHQVCFYTYSVVRLHSFECYQWYFKHESILVFFFLP